MSLKHGQLIILLIGQVCCIGVGLWLHDYQRSEAVRRDTAEPLWADLHARVIVWLESGAISPTDELPVEPLDALLRERPPRAWRAMRVDSAWAPIAPQSAADWDAGSDRLTWRPMPRRGESSGNDVRGVVRTRAGDRLALAWPLESGNGFLMCSLPTPVLATLHDSLQGQALALRLITLAWTGGAISIVAYLVLWRFHDKLERHRSDSMLSTLRQTKQLVRTRDGVIFALAKLAESRDPDTGDHLERIATYAQMLAAAARRNARFAKEIDEPFVRLIGLSSALHDIGKVGLRDGILLKPGTLTTEERKELERHTTLAGECLGQIARRVGDSTFLQMARNIAIAHHEHWDGGGYPDGLKECEIPLEARIVAIADVFDALRSRRVYKEPWSHEETVAHICENSGLHFDPDLVEVFQKVHTEFDRVSRRCALPSPVSDPAPDSGASTRTQGVQGCPRDDDAPAFPAEEQPADKRPKITASASSY